MRLFRTTSSSSAASKIPHNKQSTSKTSGSTIASATHGTTHYPLKNPTPAPPSPSSLTIQAPCSTEATPASKSQPRIVAAVPPSPKNPVEAAVRKSRSNLSFMKIPGSYASRLHRLMHRPQHPPLFVGNVGRSQRMRLTPRARALRWRIIRAVV